eukprot:CAMPEP_0116872540 /NCGR_PEP_ID=MMETSP0463-20121206/3308_1 /TAXON_ID=181622 /ORGANISM="Strombidinopsis sp, Strain SopsisLIS2011" /LENGTH=105 /DNA_ID=CAMNT_0004512899 /DNA_START=650 /DNA_END=967 /DNA_ORIENTATION=-
MICQNTIFIRVTVDPFVIESRRISGYDRKIKPPFSYKINQRFYIPITNRFERIKVDVVTSFVKGIIQGRTVEEVIKSFVIPIPFLKDKPYSYKDSLKFKFKLTDD